MKKNHTMGNLYTFLCLMGHYYQYCFLLLHLKMCNSNFKMCAIFLYNFAFVKLFEKIIYYEYELYSQYYLYSFVSATVAFSQTCCKRCFWFVLYSLIIKEAVKAAFFPLPILCQFM